MLDPWIIEEIRRREEERGSERPQPVVIEMPIHDRPAREKSKGAEEEVPRGVTVIDFGVE